MCIHLIYFLQKIESIIAMATVLNFNNTLKAINLNRPLLFTRQVSGCISVALKYCNYN